MDLNDLVRQCRDDSARWFPHPTSGQLVHYSLALAGEVGEFCNIVKKVDRGSLDINDATVRFQLRSELTDILIYVASLAAVLNVDLTKQYQYVRANNEKRFGAGKDKQ